MEVLGDLRYASSFTRGPLTLRQALHLLWAGYGCTPHGTYNCKAGLTVPSAFAAYPLTGAIYLAGERGVSRYHNRKPGDDPNTRDHRMERLRSQDIRRWLSYAVAGLPDAPRPVYCACRESSLGSTMMSWRSVSSRATCSFRLAPWTWAAISTPGCPHRNVRTFNGSWRCPPTTCREPWRVSVGRRNPKWASSRRFSPTILNDWATLL